MAAIFSSYTEINQHKFQMGSGCALQVCNAIAHLALARTNGFEWKPL
jgi:hypothetical protein